MPLVLLSPNSATCYIISCYICVVNNFFQIFLYIFIYRLKRSEPKHVTIRGYHSTRLSNSTR